MERIKSSGTRCGAMLMGLAAVLSACGGSGSNFSGGGMNPQSGNMPLALSDVSSDDWATIGVRVLSVALLPQGGGSAVTVWTAPTPAPLVNLVQLDQLAEILGNLSVPLGTYTGATLTVSANPGDVLLTVASDPEAGFPATAGATIPANQIQIQGAQGMAGSETVTINVNFDTPLTVANTVSNALDLEFDLANPAFITAHVTAGATLWAVNFNGPVRRRPHADIRWLVLRHLYGTVQSVASNNSSIKIDKDFPVVPASNPETAITSAQSLTIQADSANGTIFYDLDANTRTVVKDFSSQAMTLGGRFVRVAARYQADGSLVAVRLWASSSFNSVWLSPEGHVLHADATTDVITVENENGVGTPISVDASTQFFFRAPQNPAADAAPIGTGTGFLSSHELVRGFKVHVSVVNQLVSPWVAETVDIETAAYSGSISAATTTGFTYTHTYPTAPTASDDYTIALDYIAPTATNVDPSGKPIMGFDWWNFTFPTHPFSGSTAVQQFVQATSGSASFGGTVGTVSAWGASYAVWSGTRWQLPATVLGPTPLPLGTVVAGLNGGTSFTMTVKGGTSAATVGLNTTTGSATLVYQIDRSAAGVLTVTPLDISNMTDLATLSAALVAGTPVKVFGVPQPAGVAGSGSLQAYVLMYFTGTLPTG